LQRHLIYVSVPTLVLHLRDDVFVPFEQGRLGILAAHRSQTKLASARFAGAWSVPGHHREVAGEFVKLPGPRRPPVPNETV
jgi:hypothetical protein